MLSYNGLVVCVINKSSTYVFSLSTFYKKYSWKKKKKNVI